ncbi:MAG: hypothetical protein PHC75_08655 [Burkholderiales bacterium]|nr:hypothetical protein [Burkholderiales bacterium]
MFFGMSFIGSTNSNFASPIYRDDVDYMEVKNGIIDDLYLTANVTDAYTTEIPTIWDYDTILHAKFEGDLFAGNADFSMNTVSHLRVKRRKKGTYKWVTLFEIPINKKEDFNFTKTDRYARGKTEYEWAIVPVLNGTEGNYNIASLTTSFEGIFIVDANKIYHSKYNIGHINPKRQKPSTVVVPIDRRYPFVISNGEVNYYSGEIKATFIEESVDGEDTAFNFERAWEYRDGFKDWLLNGSPKIIKYDDGRMWLVMVTGDIDEETDGHWDNVKTTFGFTEIGDCESNQDLYNNGLIDVYMDGE